jgi:hypothetical protein
MSPPTWQTLDWNILDRLRRVFLGLEQSPGPYWTTRADLAHYDMTYAQRIGWKWDAVLRDLHHFGWVPPAGPLLDWGCGSGVASRAVLDAFGADRFGTLLLFDRSLLAMEYAAERARTRFPGLEVRIHSPSDLPRSGTGVPCEASAKQGNGSGASGTLTRSAPHIKEFVSSCEVTPRDESGTTVGTLVVSHVVNELTDADRAPLLDLARRSGSVLWVEPGTHADSRSLIRAREELRATMEVVGPCTHAAGCGMLAPANERHWCHFFADPPTGIMGDSDWVRFAQRAGIDLRSLPYSYLALQRRGGASPGLHTRTAGSVSLLPSETELRAPAGRRIIGVPRLYKGYAKILTCQADGVREVMLNKRDDSALFARLKRDHEFPPFPSP